MKQNIEKKCRRKKGPILIGLTGSIGMGKSTAASLFIEQGVPLFDADAEIMKLQAKDSPFLDKIKEIFPDVVDNNGLDRVRLGALVFGKPKELARLENIMHPEVEKRREKFVKDNQQSEIIIFDIPLLFEKARLAGLDYIIVVSANAQVQRRRVLARPGMTEEKFNHILGIQVPDTEKCKRADFILDNNGTIQELKEQIIKLLNQLSAKIAKEHDKKIECTGK